MKTIFTGLFLAFLLCGAKMSMAQTVLNPGDLIIVAMNGDTDATYGRGFSFMPLVNLEAGTEIFFTDYGWSDVAGAFINSSAISDVFIKYTAPAGGVTAGTVIRNATNLTTNFVFYFSYGISTYDYVNIVGVAASDEVLAFQGSISSPKFIFAATYVSTDVVSSGWATAVAASGGTNGVGSALPGTGNASVADLVDDVTALSFNQPSTANDNCAYTGPTSAATKEEWQARIRNYSNWTFNDAVPIPVPMSGSYTVLLPSSAPTVTTQAVSNISTTTATGNGNVTATGGANIIERGIHWSLSNGFANGTGTKVSTTGDWGTTGTFTQEITGLSPGTTYYVKAFATNSAGTSYGSQVSFTTKAIPTITWSNPADITYGTLLSATQLNATANTAGIFTYTPTLGTKLNAGNGQTLQVDFTPTDLTNYDATSKTVTIHVAKATPVITWSNPENITFGTPLSATQLNAEADVDGSFVYTPDFGTILSVEDGQNLQADFTPTDTDNYISTSKTVIINIVLGTNMPETNKNILVLYPNPTTDNFALAGLQSDAQITISDLKGLSILNKKIGIGEHVTVHSLSKGIYIVQIVTSGKTYNMQLIKK